MESKTEELKHEFSRGLTAVPYCKWESNTEELKLKGYFPIAILYMLYCESKTEELKRVYLARR